MEFTIISIQVETQQCNFYLLYESQEPLQNRLLSESMSCCWNNLAIDGPLNPSLAFQDIFF